MLVEMIEAYQIIKEKSIGKPLIGIFTSAMLTSTTATNQPYHVISTQSAKERGKKNERHVDN